MRLALIGYGKMGHEIERVALSRNHQVVLRIDKDNISDLNTLNKNDVDVAFEFTTPYTAYSNILTCIEHSVPVVCGTTGWLDKLDEIRKLVKSNDSALFYASNYSLGVNIFFRINELASKYISKSGGYSPKITEIHHTQKLDAPSGTAISIANIISGQLQSYHGWSLLPSHEEGKIPIEAIREGETPGTHYVTFESEQDEIQLTHKAKSRKGFAIGAVIAAEFLIGKKGCFTMDDLLLL